MFDELLSTQALWQMSMSEKATIIYLLGKMKQKLVAFEVGSYKGGFTRILSKRFRQVYSLDTNHSNIVEKEKFKNVTWVEGNSLHTLPNLLAQAGHPDLILIDGDHEYEAVLSDINALLKSPPERDCLILMHDSWYQPTRDAINNAFWRSNPYVHFVEKDLCSGDLVGGPRGNHFVGGLAVALLSPKEREGELEIRQSHDYAYRVCRDKVELR